MMIHVVHAVADAPVGKLCFFLFEVTPEMCPLLFPHISLIADLYTLFKANQSSEAL